MSDNSKIEWTDATWNPVRGCSKISPGCLHCYAETFAERFRGVPGHPFEFGFDLRLVPEKLGDPIRWSKPKKIFVNSMSDLFHEQVPTDFIRDVFEVMADTPQHTYQVLTKRSRRLAKMADCLPWPANVWMGVSVENHRYRFRIDHLREVPAAVRFLSAEPLLGPLRKLELEGIAWVIVGGESGPGARPMDHCWATDIRDRCVDSGVAFFFKQWGGRTPKAGGRELDGRTWDETPEVLPVR